MSNGTVQLTPDSTGKKVDTSEITVGSNTVQRQRVNLSDPSDSTAHAAVRSQDGLSSNDFGIVTRSIIHESAEALKRPLMMLARALGTAAEPSTGQLRATCTISSGTITTVTTVTNVTSVNQVAGQDAKLTVLYDLSRQTWALNVRSRIS